MVLAWNWKEMKTSLKNEFISLFITNMVGEGEVEEAGSLDLAPVGYNSTVQYSTVQ